MAENDASVLILAVIAAVAFAGLGLALASFATNESVGGMMGGYGGGPMMNRTTSTASAPGVVEWGILIVSVVILGVAVVLLLRARSVHAEHVTAVGSPPVASLASAPPGVPAGPGEGVPAGTPTPPPAVPEPTLVKLLSEDERRMYLELRDHGGMMYQRDLVALGIFSKAKVTRVLDKLEAKGLVVREAHGMTNRVRLVTGPAK